MKKIIKLAGVQVDNDNLPIVAASEDERALASIPGLFFWLQAGGFKGANESYIDRVSGGAITPRTLASVWTEGEMGGAPALVAGDGWVSTYDVPTSAEFNPERWSVVMVVSVSPTASGVGELLGSTPGAGTAGVLNMRLGFTSSNSLMLREGVALDRLEVPASGWVGQPALIVLTFSVERGIAAFVNGELVATNSGDRRPLNTTTFHIGKPGDGLRSETAFHGKIGHLMLFNTDLSAPENGGYRRVIDGILMPFYGIS